ncbi:GAF domain-containing protein [Flaviaesturariibacter amylovorans]|uniref:GAF domain-containing protein n=1 Tax=Flaviaesturariibacter amylovorans TaxID=1084520 RepID=A0ABP8H4M6_9BACT
MDNSFGKNIIPENERARIDVLSNHNLLEKVPQGYFNNLAQIVAKTFDMPIALVSLVKSEEVEFIGNKGMEGTKSAPRGVSLCSLAVLGDQPIVFPDALEGPCLLANPLVRGEFGLRFYAGAPIISPTGESIGTVCVVDKGTRDFSEEDIRMLQYFANVAMNEIIARVQTLKGTPGG